MLEKKGSKILVILLRSRSNKHKVSMFNIAPFIVNLFIQVHMYTVFTVCAQPGDHAVNQRIISFTYKETVA